ncbi:MAG: ABC transporter substrate-binding protein, partial [Desulfobacterales bacterium]
LGVQPVTAEIVLKVNLDSALNQLDPIWTTAYIVRSHGFMVYDTLFGLDADFKVQPQMVETYTVSADGMEYSFTLRDGLKWHDGTPVTSKDCVASIKRWGARDGMGQKLMAATATLEAVDDQTFTLKLQAPFGMVLQSLAKITSNVPFMMKEEHALTSPDEQVQEVVGSGPFRFVKEEFKPGVNAVYVKNEAYVPRQEPASNTAGGKVVHLDRVEFAWIPDTNTCANALMAGEIDFIQVPQADFLPKLKAAAGVKVEIFDPLGIQTVARLNHLQPPFDNPKARQAVLWATSQETALRAAAGNDPELFAVCPSMYPCGSPLASDVGSDPLLKQDFVKAKQLLKEIGYQNEPIVVLHVTDDFIISNQTLATAQNLRKAGFNVDLQAMNWSTLVARRAIKKPASEGGWHIFQTWFNGPDFLNPLEHMAIGAACDKAWFGWPCDEEIEKMRAAFGAEPDSARQKELAQAIQKRAYEVVTYVPLGTVYQPVAYRADRLEGLIKSPVPLFWNVRKK